MDTSTQVQTFFFISSVGFVILWILLAIFLFYLIRAMATLSRVMDKLENDINKIGDATKEVLTSVKDSMVFNLLFKKSKKTAKK